MFPTVFVYSKVVVEATRLEPFVNECKELPLINSTLHGYPFFCGH